VRIQDPTRELGSSGLGAVVAVGSFLCYLRAGVFFGVRSKII
jgi:hypothetical protein